MYGKLKDILTDELKNIREAGLFKAERIILGPQSSEIQVKEGDVLNFCANNYLGLSSHPALIKAAHDALEKYAFGMSSVRFICGTLDVHKELEKKISEFNGTEDTILYSSCFDANGGLFETLLGAEDAIISDSLNHASVIDGVRLCKAQRYRYKNNDMADLEARLQEADSKGARVKMIATDGVFSMDGIIANLKGICDLADRYEALVMVDDSHATGFVGKTGRGSAEHNGVMGRVDVITSTLGKALGGASGGYTTGRKEMIDMLRQRSRPYLFSNTLAPVITATTLKVLEVLSASTELRDRLMDNAAHFRKRMSEAGFKLAGADHAIVPVMLGDARLAGQMADDMLKRGIYVIGFSYPVVPKGEARIRVQLSASHTPAQIDRCVDAFIAVGKQHGVIK
ncbi:MAG: glycine C-acetyltransferase [Polyangia bacterium]|jgi:glycine C-acetyltransferase|nr:glycine C-acetyltransferase [Polyangia bacterium]